MYSPREIYHFLTSKELKDIIGVSFYKRHMESDDITSPFNDPEKILLLEWLIDQNYIIAEYRGESGKDNETYLMSTLGHAFVRNYTQSRSFRFHAHWEFYKTLYWVLVASGLGSIIANYITHYTL